MVRPGIGENCHFRLGGGGGVCLPANSSAFYYDLLLFVVECACIHREVTCWLDHSLTWRIFYAMLPGQSQKLDVNKVSASFVMKTWRLVSLPYGA